MMSEAIIIALICLSTGLSVSSWLSKPIANGVLQNQIEQTNNHQNESQNQLSLTDFQPHLDADAMTYIVLLTGALVIISSLSGVFFIMRYEPRRILSERD